MKESQENTEIIEEPLHVGEWQLTWPIWHLLSLAEKEEIAARRGLSVGAFEEEINLQRATELSVENDGELHRYVSTFRVTGPMASATTIMIDEGKERVDNHVTSSDDEEEEYDEDDQCTDSNVYNRTSSSVIRPSFEDIEEGHGGQMCLLPDEILFRIMHFIDVDAFGVMAMVSPHWKFFTTSENSFKLLCERSYLNQSKKKVLNLQRWKTYRNMFLNRPRVRLNGMYVLKYKQIKQIQRDMWTEIPMGAILEQVYYRYLCFQENGYVLYALTASPPYDMIPRFARMKRTQQIDKQAVIGRYEISKHDIRVWSSHKWSDVSLDLKILSYSPYRQAPNFTELRLVRHRISQSGDFDHSNDVVELEVPSEAIFRFVRVWNL